MAIPDAASATANKLAPPKLTSMACEGTSLVQEATQTIGTCIKIQIGLPSEDRPSPLLIKWRLTWLRGAQASGCRFEGCWDASRKDEGDTTSSFIVSANKMGLEKRNANAEPIISLQAPGRYVLLAWIEDGKGAALSSPVMQHYRVEYPFDDDEEYTMEEDCATTRATT